MFIASPSPSSIPALSISFYGMPMTWVSCAIGKLKEPEIPSLQPPALTLKPAESAVLRKQLQRACDNKIKLIFCNVVFNQKKITEQCPSYPQPPALDSSHRVSFHLLVLQ